MQIQKIKNVIEGEVLFDEKTLVTYSHDASVFEIKPEVVVFPKNVEDIKKLVTLVSTEKDCDSTISITPRAAGTCMSGGAVNDSIILDVSKYLNTILEIGYETIVESNETAISYEELGNEDHDPKLYEHLQKQHKPQINSFKGDPYVSVQPGAFYRDLEKYLSLHKLMMPGFPASKNICAIGGMVGNNSGGEKSLAYGQCKDYVQELDVVLSDGNEYHFGPLHESALEKKMKLLTFEGQLYRDVFQLVSENKTLLQKAKPTTTKNATGYFLWDVWDSNKRIFNMAALFVGSQGTLGIITNVRFRLIPEKPVSSLLVILLPNNTQLGTLIEKVKKFYPESFEMFDSSTVSVAKKVLPKNVTGIFSSKKIIPELVLLVNFTGNTADEVAANLTNAQRSIQNNCIAETHIVTSKAEAEHYWTIRRESFNMLRHLNSKKSTAPFIDDIIVHPSQLPEFLPRLNEIFVKYQSLTYTIAGHAGDANFHIIPLMDFSKATERAIIPKLSAQVFKLVADYKGSMSAEHNDGLIRGPYLKSMYGEPVFALFQEVKRIFDPKNIFNPHKKTDATMHYQADHIKRK